MEPIVVWGAGGHAKVVAATIRRQGRWELHGFIDDVNADHLGQSFMGSTILGGRGVLAGLWDAGIRFMVLAFGNCEARVSIWQEMSEIGFQFPTICDPDAMVAEGVQLGAGCFVGRGAIINVDARIGAQVIVNTAAIVEHDCEIADGVHLAPRACLAGHVSVGLATFVGAGSVVRDRKKIGARCVIGAGSVVVRDIPDDVMAYGCPARVEKLR